METLAETLEANKQRKLKAIRDMVKRNEALRRKLGL